MNYPQNPYAGHHKIKNSDILKSNEYHKTKNNNITDPYAAPQNKGTTIINKIHMQHHKPITQLNHNNRKLPTQMYQPKYDATCSQPLNTQQ